MTWPIAFALTQLLEMPVYWFGTRASKLSVGKRLAAGFGASALTHPILWFVLYPTLIGLIGYWPFFVVGEALVVIVEALYLGAFGVKRPWLVALAANTFSATVGLILTPLLVG